MPRALSRRSSLAVLTCLNLSAAFACECSRPDQTTAFRRASVVFLGTATELTKVPIEGTPRSGLRGLPGDQRELITFKVAQIWKGPRTQTIKIHNFSKVSYCDCYAFEAGKQYLVYGTNTPAGPAGWGDLYGNKVEVLSTGGLCILRIQSDLDDRNLLGSGWVPK
jgi:hypothetical protein